MTQMTTPPGLVSAFVTLLATIGPIETAAIFIALTHAVHKPERKRLAARSTVIASIMLVAFALIGGPLLDYLHVSMPAFRIAGGLLLFLQALTLTFSSPGLASIDDRERRDAEAPGDIAVFPLAFPVIAGPGPLSAIVLLMGRTQSLGERGSVLAMLLACLGLTYIAMRIGTSLERWLGRTGADVVGRISGVLLAGLAVQFVLDGLWEEVGQHLHHPG